MSRPGLRPAEFPLQWILEAVSLGLKQPRHEADLFIMLRLMCGAIPIIPQNS
jgi:hypothetical protein